MWMCARESVATTTGSMIFSDMSAGTNSQKVHPPNGTRYYTFQARARSSLLSVLCGGFRRVSQFPGAADISREALHLLTVIRWDSLDELPHCF
ncbi:hypothetical protein DPEC_G00113990 [Dallia pectoralis]|uniref:Uncharacterized protein n=1 Tax=Dallia pectoralis TaxID=75939 RepID=A0ACC2GTJ8_DALPE|nr:hypothetical protein DPEC_G00113990 [Dallia pectoralis]